MGIEGMWNVRRRLDSRVDYQLRREQFEVVSKGISSADRHVLRRTHSPTDNQRFHEIMDTLSPTMLPNFQKTH